MDRLAEAEYLAGLLNEDEVFGMDDLGNRTTVNLRSGANQVYATDTPNITNRYTAVGGQPLAYDAAGNLTQDHDGYRYVYDHENRITRIFKLNGQTEIDVAQYAYDALGRRIGKYDAAAMETTFYYYNDQWQILAEYTDDTTCRQWFTYGNYIDEVLSRNAHPYGLILAMQYYAHDHLYSPAALANYNGFTVWERYEYDAYGKVTITGRGADNLWYTADDVTLSASAYNNPFTFTGRQLDILDNGNLHHMHYRHRDYSPALGRFLQHDPLGIDPMSSELNYFKPEMQYNDGHNLYNGYFAMHMRLDPTGTRELSEIIRLAKKGMRGLKLMTCSTCLTSTQGIKAMCAVARGICGEDLDPKECLCETIKSNTAWKIICNSCLFPLSLVYDAIKGMGC
ncbi:MAG: hypothetical protein GXY41_03450 [Phycisphaerae bacterium]|nr:hypothetical protein [Phycisphaerae bacterium]